MIKVSDYVVKCLEQLDVKHMFMLPGGGSMHLNDSLGKSECIEYIACLHEQACAIAAEAYARVTNKPGLLMVTTGPGGTNAITGVAAAYIESTPMIIISGQVKTEDLMYGQGIRQQGMQEVDIVSIVRPITKYAVMVTKAENIRYCMEKAIYEATHGRKGPVWVDITLDVQAGIIDETKLDGFVPDDKEQGAQSQGELEKQVLDLIKHLNKAERPVIMLGNGIRLAGAIDEMRETIEQLGIPVLTTWNGIDLVAEDYPLFFGRPGGMGQRYANFIQQNSDFFLAVGARLNLLQTGYNYDGFARAAYKVMVDIDEGEMHKRNVRIDKAICADSKEFFEVLLKYADQIDSKPRTEWLEYAVRMKKAYPVLEEKYWKESEFVNTYVLLDSITEQMREDDIYVSGSSGTCIDVSMQMFRVKAGQRVFATKGLASMGFGVPATIGACLAGECRRTVCVNGDGGFQMNIQELETIHRLNLPIKIFVLNNHGYAQIYATQTNVFQKHFVACNQESGLSIPNISDIAEAYQIKTVQIKHNGEVHEKVKKVLEYKGPVICEVFVPITLSALPKQVSYKRGDGQMESLPLEYMNPMLSDEEMEQNMLIPLYSKK